MIAFDIEVRRAIRTHGETDTPGIEYCAGWKDFAGMGIACLCTVDVDTRLARVFFEEDLLEAASYLGSAPTLGFNSRRFDLPLLVATGGVTLPPMMSAHLDLLECVWVAQGLDPDRFGGAHQGWTLDTLCRATLGRGKDTTGALSPYQWQRGQKAAVINRCLYDCALTADLYVFAQRHGYVQRQETKNPDKDVVFLSRHLVAR